jgi:hypothetical protein
MRLGLGVVAAAALTLATTGAATRPPSPAPPLATAGVVRELSADGGRVGMILDTVGTPCHSISVWAPGRHVWRVVEPTLCAASPSEDTFGLALAGKRIAWVHSAGGNTLELELRTATLSAPKPRRLVFAASAAGVGDHVGAPRGDGPLLAFSTLRDRDPVEAGIWRYSSGADAQPCLDTQLAAGARTCAPVAAAAEPLDVLAVNAARIVVRRAAGALTIFGADGSIQIDILPDRGYAHAAELDGNRLVVLRRDASGRPVLDVHDALTGALTATLPIAEKALSLGPDRCEPAASCRLAEIRLADVHAGRAVVVSGSDVRVIRLDGRETRITTPGLATVPVHAQLEPDGLYYSYGVRHKQAGRVVFVPSGKIP